MNIKFDRITEDDLEFLCTVRNLYAEEYLHDSRKFDLYETFNWYKKTKPDYWMIFLEGTKIGYFRLSNHSSTNKNIYIGADISPEYTGKGYAKESYKKFIPFLFKEYNLHKISLEVLSSNTRAINLYESVGFNKDGIKRQEVYKNGGWVDSIIMSILKQEYENRN